ncbi:MULTISPECIES: glycoside hydrolase family 55 protein, partial [Bacillus subtilis group]
MYQLEKQHNPVPNAKLLSQLDENAWITENALNDNIRALNSHKEAKKAHTSEQISHHSGLTVSQEIETGKARLRNLVLNADGTNIKEVVDARVDRKGTIYPTLWDRLAADGQYIETRFNFKNALNYGADPTGKSPSAWAIQKALDEIHREGGGQLVIPEGIYLIEKRIYIYGNTRFTMSPSCVLLRGWAGGFFANGTPNDKFTGYSGRGNIIIEG